MVIKGKMKKERFALRQTIIRKAWWENWDEKLILFKLCVCLLIPWKTFKYSQYLCPVWRLSVFPSPHLSVFILCYSQPCSGHTDLLAVLCMLIDFSSLGVFSQTAQSHLYKEAFFNHPILNWSLTHTHTTHTFKFPIFKYPISLLLFFSIVHIGAQ